MTRKQRMKAVVYMAVLLASGILIMLCCIPLADNTVYPNGTFLDQTYLIPVAHIYLGLGAVIALISGFALVLLLLKEDPR